MVSGFAFAFLSVFDCFAGAFADTGHAVGALAAPLGFLVGYADVVERAELCAFAAAGTGVCGVEFLGAYDERVERAIDDSAAEPG